MTADAGGVRSARFFEACEQLIPFEELAASIADIHDREGPDRGGRPHWPIVLMLKCMLIQKWFNLSYPMLEEMLRDRLIKDYRFDTARVHDSQYVDELVREETHAVWADNAYTSQARREHLESRVVFAGIVYRRNRGQAELTPSQQAMNWLVRKRRAPVEHPFARMKNKGHRRARYRGLIRNGFDFAMWAISYNWLRSLRMLNPA